MSESSIVSLNILDKIYQIKCRTEKIAELRESAELLEEKMRSTKQSNHMLGGEKLTILASLNIAHEFLLQEKQMQEMCQRIEELQNKVELALASCS